MGSSATEVDQLLRAARLHLAQGEFHEAAERAAEAIRRDGKAVAAYLLRAEAHRRLRKPERALADLAVAIRLDPQRPGPYVVRAEILRRRNVFDQSIADATYALTLDPRNAAAFSIRAQCRHAIGDREGAAEDVQEMLLIDPTRPVPDLGAGPTTASPIDSDDEPSWKRAGHPASASTSDLFADGKPVDKTYRSRPAVVSDEEAPEELGAASGYRPEVMSRPLPRTRPARRPARGTSPLPALLVGGLCVLGGGYLMSRFGGGQQPSPEAPGVTAPSAPIAGDRSTISGVTDHGIPSGGSPAPAERPGRSTAPSAGSDSAVAGATSRAGADLIGLVDTARDSVGDAWIKAGGTLLSPSSPRPRLQLPVMPGRRYTVSMLARRVGGGGDESLHIGLPLGDDRQVVVILDGMPGYHHGLSLVDGKRADENGSGSAGRVFRPGEWTSVSCSVEPGRITATVGGRTVVDWRGSFDRLGLMDRHAVPRKDVIFLGSVSSPYEFKALALLDGGPAPLDAPEPVGNGAGDNAGAGVSRSPNVETEPVKLRVAISEQGECRVLVGRSITDETVRPGDGMTPITTSYANSFVGGESTACEEPGSSRFEPTVPEFAKASSMLLYPRAFRLPCLLTMDIAELRDGSVGVQFLTPTTNVVIYVESDDVLRETAFVRAVASVKDRPGGGPAPGNAQQRVSIEQPVSLSSPEELRFRLPVSPEQLGDLYTLDAVLRARPGQMNPNPSVAIRNAELVGRVDRTLGMDLGVGHGKPVVERVEPGGLAEAAGVRVGDILVTLDGNTIPPLKDAGALTFLIEFGMKPTALMTVLRGGREQEITIDFE